MLFGLAAPVFANPGVAYFRTPNAETVDWDDITSLVREAELLGYGSVWVADHMFLGKGGEFLEHWTVLSALATLTTNMRLGTIHHGIGFRHAPLVAKMAATLDVISHGRLEFFVEPGWREREHTSYGFDWYRDRDNRVDRLAEAIQVMRRLWTGGPVSFEGKYYRLDGAISTPRPVRPKGPRIWMGESLSQRDLDLIVREADVWNSVPASPQLLKEKIEKLDQACERGGRDPNSIVKTLETQVLVYRDTSERDALFQRFAELRRQYPSDAAMSDVFAFLREINPNLDASTNPEDFADEWVMGTPTEVAAKLKAYRDLGIEEVICWFMDYPERTSLRLLASEVMPGLAVPSHG